MVGSQLALAGTSGVIVTTRLRPQAMITLLPGLIAGIRTRIYFDWLDASNHHYAEALSPGASSVTNGGEYGEMSLAIYRVEDGETTTLAGPTDVRTLANLGGRLTGFTVQFCDTGTPGQKYVQAIGGEGAGWWIGCLTTFFGTQCGIGAAPAEGTPAPVLFDSFVITNCSRALLNHCHNTKSEVTAPDAACSNSESNCYYARPCGEQLTTGIVVSGSVTALADSPIVYQTSGGVLDVAYTLYMQANRDPRYAEILIDGTPSIFSQLQSAVWNFVHLRWEKTPPLLTPSEGTEGAYTPEGSSVITYGVALQRCLTSEHVDSSGRAVIRFVFNTGGADQELTVNTVRGCRAELPMPLHYYVELGHDFPAWIRGVYELTWSPTGNVNPCLEGAMCFGNWSYVGHVTAPYETGAAVEYHTPDLYAKILDDPYWTIVICLEFSAAGTIKPKAILSLRVSSENEGQYLWPTGGDPCSFGSEPAKNPWAGGYRDVLFDGFSFITDDPEYPCDGRLCGDVCFNGFISAGGEQFLHYGELDGLYYCDDLPGITVELSPYACCFPANPEPHYPFFGDPDDFLWLPDPFTASITETPVHVRLSSTL
jgi:hypothetical protein